MDKYNVFNWRLPGITTLRCLLPRLVLESIQCAGAFRDLYAGVFVLDQSGWAEAALDASAGFGVLRQVSGALHVCLGSTYVEHVPVCAVVLCKICGLALFLPKLLPFTHGNIDISSTKRVQRCHDSCILMRNLRLFCRNPFSCVRNSSIRML
jgi:hypothetical protein